MKAITSLVMLAVWVIGWVLAHGFWSTLFAVVMPPWSWYLVAERLVERFL